MADIVSGTFNSDMNGILSVVSGPEITRAVLEQLQNLVSRAASKEINLEQFQREVAELSPTLAEAISPSLNAPSRVVILLMLLGLALKSCASNPGTKLDVNQLFDQITRNRHNSALNDLNNPKQNEVGNRAEATGSGTSKKDEPGSFGQDHNNSIPTAEQSSRVHSQRAKYAFMLLELMAPGCEPPTAEKTYDGEVVSTLVRYNGALLPLRIPLSLVPAEMKIHIESMINEEKKQIDHMRHTY